MPTSRIDFAQFFVETDKVRLYLLNIHHLRRQSKARFFIGWGFDPQRGSEFAAALIAHAKTAGSASVSQGAWGWTVVCDGPLSAPNGTTPPVRTVWEIKSGDTAARLVTAYPL